MIITTNEFQDNFNKYIGMAATEDIILTRDGQTIAMLVKPEKSAVSSLRGLLGGVSDIDIREERVSKYENNDRH